jgi:hypothetical protein
MSKAKRPPDQQAFLDELGGLWPLAKGCLVEVRKPCIRPNCSACRSGKKHKAMIFSFTQAGKQRCRYVPAALAPLLRQALTNGRRVEQRLVELGSQWLEQHRRPRT